jgi:hypothetical protein
MSVAGTYAASGSEPLLKGVDDIRKAGRTERPTPGSRELADDLGAHGLGDPFDAPTMARKIRLTLKKGDIS